MVEEEEALVFQLLPSVDNLVFLLEVCAELKVTISADKQGNKHFIVKSLLKYLNSDEIEALEDGGLFVFLKLGDDLRRLLKLESDEGIKMEIGEQSKNETLETDSKTEGKTRIQKFRDFKIYGTVVVLCKKISCLTCFYRNKYKMGRKKVILVRKFVQGY